MQPSGDVFALLKSAEHQLSDVSDKLARRDAEILLAHVVGIALSRLPLLSTPLSAVQVEAFEDCIGRRANGEPVAYITGEQEFWSLTFGVNHHTLIPRPDTETLVETALGYLRTIEGPRLLDLGTGSGCVLLSLLHEKLDATGIGVDVSDGALEVAQQNSERLGLVDRAQLERSNWYSSLDGFECFDLIASNPPYIETKDIESLMPDVRNYEPASALDGGKDGMDCYRDIASGASSFLKPGGMLVVEIGVGQEDAVLEIFEGEHLVECSVTADLAGINRVVAAKKAKES